MHSLHSRDIGMNVGCQKLGLTAARKTDTKVRASPGLTCPSSYCFVNQPFLKFSRSGCKKGERRSEAGVEASAPSRGAGNSSGLIQHSAEIKETSNS